MGNKQKIIVTFLYSLLVVVIFCLPVEFDKQIGVANLIILSVTFFALYWYAWETQKLKEITLSQLKLQQTPFLTIYIKQHKDIGHQFFIKNSGNGLAVRIQIINIDFTVSYNDNLTSPEGNRIHKIEFPKVASLAANEEKEINILGRTKERGVVVFQRNCVGDIPFSENKKIRIEYENLIGEKYYSIVALSIKENTIEEYSKINL